MSRLNIKHINLFLLLSVFILLFDPVLGSLPFKLSYGYSLIFILVYISKSRSFNSFEIALITLTLPFVIYSIYPLYTTYANFTVLDFFAIKNFFAFIITLIVAKLLSNIYIKYLSDPSGQFIKHCFFSVSINSSIIIFSNYSTEFIQLLEHIFAYSPKQLKSHSLETTILPRFSGVAYSGFSDLSIFTSILFLCGLVYYKTGIFKNLVSRFLVISFLFIIFYSMVYIARSGFLLLLLVFIMYLLKNCLILFQNLSFKPNFLYTILAIFIAIFGLVFYIKDSVHNDFIFELLTLDFLNSSTMNEITSMWLIPNDTFDILFGSGNFGLLGDSKIPTDIGYVYLINGVGILGVLMFFLPILVMLYRSFFYTSKHLSFLTFYSIMPFFIFNFKDFYFLGYFGSSFLIMMFYYLSYSQQRDSNA